MRSARILMLDSGVGGLSVMLEIIARMPELSIDYVADHAYLPYGSKSPQELTDRISYLVTQASQHLTSEDDSYDLVVIACNTASTVVLDHLRTHFSVPFVGVVPAIKPACEKSVSKKIGLLATEGTVTRNYTHDLIRSFGSDHEVTLVGSSELVMMAEQKLSGQRLSQHQLQIILKPFKDANVDTIVLGCTHFPLIKDELDAAVDWPVNWVDSGEAIARRVEYLLTVDCHGVTKKPQGSVQVNKVRYFSTTAAGLPNLGEEAKGHIFKHFEYVAVFPVS